MGDITRRALFASAFAAAAGVLAGRLPASADDGQALIMGSLNSADSTTALSQPSSNINGALNVYGGDVGVRAQATQGIIGFSLAGIGLVGDGQAGRGGEFKGARAQIRLVPGQSATHPASGKRGDLYLDRQDRLWLCRGRSDWARVA